MTSMYGTCESFDYDSFRLEQCTVPRVERLVYPDGTIMALLQKERPRFAQIVTKSKYDRKLADIQARLTIFVTDYWERFPAVQIDQLDVDACKQVVMENTVNGRIRAEDIRTSQDSQLFSLRDGVLIHLWLDARDSLYKKEQEVLVEQRVASNGIIHFTQYPHTR